MIIEIENYQFDCSENGVILRLMKSGNWKEIPNKANHIKGYNVIMINKKQYLRSQIIAHAFLNHDLNDKSVIICYLDQDKLNNSKDNLDIRLKPKKKEQS